MDSILNEIAEWAGTRSPEEAVAFCDRLLRAYATATDETRSAIRAAVASSEAVRQELLYDSVGAVGPGRFLDRSFRQATESGDYASYLRSALLAMSIADGFADSRDTLMWLAEEWRQAEAHGVDPHPVYEETGGMSSLEAVHTIGGPMAFMILQMRDERRRDELRW